MSRRYFAKRRADRARRLVVESLESRVVPASYFRVASLTANNSAVVDPEFVTGSDKGGIAVSTSQVFVTGQGAPPTLQGTGQFDRTDLSGGTNVDSTYDALTGDLHTQKIYSLGAGPGMPLLFGGGTVKDLLEINGATGALTGGFIALSTPVNVSYGTGIFAGYDRVILHSSTDNHVYEIALPSGTVTDLGAVTTSDAEIASSWAYWGVAEHFGGKDYLDYALQNPFGPVNTIVRQQVQSGQESAVATLSDLSTLSSFTVSPSNDRWYFNFKGPGQFGGFPETLGLADGTFATADFVVTNTNDSGPGSLRQAILNANAAPGTQTIGFDITSGTITLTSGDIVVTDSVNLDGPGGVTVEGNANNRIFADGSGGTLTLGITGLTLSNPAGFNFPYAVNVTGDTTITAGAGDISFTKTLTVSVGTLTLTDGNTVDLGTATTIDGAVSAVNGYTLSAGDKLTGKGFVAGSVFDGGTLAGNLTISGNVIVQNGGTISPGASPRVITINGNLQVQTGGTLTFELDGPFFGQYDRLVVNGLVDLGTGTNFIPTLNYAANPGDTLDLIENDGTDAITGQLNNTPNGQGMVIGGTQFLVHYNGGSGNDLYIIANSSPTLNTTIDTRLTPIIEDVPPSENPGTTIDSLVATGGLYSDPDGVPPWGIAVTGLNSGNGSWQYTLNGGASWTTFGTVSPSFSTLLAADGAGQDRIRFLPNGNFFGTADLSFKAWDRSNGRPDGSTGVDASSGGGNSAYSAGTETATIDVLAVNHPPVAVPDSYTLAENTTLTVSAASGVLANDSDVDGPFPLTASLVNGPAHGTLTLNSNGSFVYTPTTYYNGPDSFVYKVSDALGAFDVGLVSLTVTWVNQNPTAKNDIATLPENGGAVTIDVLSNDSCAPDVGETLTITSVSQGAHGSVAITSAGKFVTYTPQAYYHGPDSFTYTISDGNGGTATATVNVTVTWVNQNPTANNDTASVTEDAGPQTIDVLANDTDAPDVGETLTVVSVTQGLHGTVAISTGGTAVTYTPDAEFSGNDTFVYRISDGNGGSAVATVEVTVNNDASDRLEVVTSSGMTTFTESVPPPSVPVVVDAGVRVGPGLEGVMTGATVKISAGYVKGKDKLALPLLGPIKGKFAPATGTLSLNGIASPADYQAALRAITYVNTSPAPVDGVRAISFQVQDVAGVGVPATKLLNVVGVDTKPVLTLMGPGLTYKTRGKAMAVASPLKIVDVDNTRLAGASVSISGGFQIGDVLAVRIISTMGITASYVSGVLTLTGNATLANYLSVLKSLTFLTPTATLAGTRTISITVNDGQLDSDPVTRSITVI
jgi:hypothetical protein